MFQQVPGVAARYRPTGPPGSLRKLSQTQSPFSLLLLQLWLVTFILRVAK